MLIRFNEMSIKDLVPLIEGSSVECDYVAKVKSFPIQMYASKDFIVKIDVKISAL